MAGSNTFSRLLIVNGQPILLKDIDLNSSRSYTTDILQQAINDVSSDPLTCVMDCSTTDNSTLNSDLGINVVDGTGSEYVAELSSDQSVEDTSTIRLTVEQASELGLHFTMDHLNQNISLNTVQKESIEDSSKDNYTITTNSSNTSNNAGCVKMDCDTVQNVDVIDKDDVGNSLLDSFHPVSPSSSQELSILPHFVNGTVTYTLQLSNQMLSQSNDNGLYRITEPSVISQDSEQVDNQLRYDLTNLTSSSDLPFINSLDVVPNKFSENSVHNISENETSNQTFGLVSCNSENITFLSLADSIPVGSSISNIIRPTQENAIKTAPQQSKLFNNVCDIIDVKTKNKKFVNPNQSRESLLVKHQHISSPSPQNGIRFKTRTKPTDKVNVNHVSFLPSKKIIETSDSQVNVNCEHLETNKCLQEYSSTLQKNQSVDSSLNEDLLTSLKDITRVNDKRTEDSSDTAIQTPTIITPNGGEVPKEVSAALSRIPIKTDSNKPLGSNENPIKLVQQGSTFHSMQALTEDHISKIKPILNEKFDTKTTSKNVVYDPASNTRIIYRIISPEEVELRKQTECPRRRGKPKKIHSSEKQSEETEGAPPPKKVFPRTRSGRLSRPPKHMVRDYKHIRRLDADDSDGGYSDYQSENEEDITNNLDTAPVELLPGLVAKRKNHKRNISAGNLCPTCGKIYLGFVRMKRHFDKYPDHGSIEHLNNVRSSNPDSESESNKLENGNVLWRKTTGKRKGKGKNNCFTTADKRTRLKEVLEWCEPRDVADIAGPTVAGVLSLWQLLLLRVDSVKRDSRVAALYDELCQMLTTLRHIAHKIFRPLDHPLPTGTKHITVQVEDEIMTGLLNIPCGVYLASDEDLDSSTSPSTQELPLHEPQIATSLPLIEKKTQEKIVQEAKGKIDIDDVPQPFLEEMICDSGLVNVDDIVSERLQNFTGSQTSSVDELMKGLNELEQRTKLETDDLMEGFSIVSRRTHVSASTEDLMKSLEHFESDLNHADAPSSLDRDTFDRVSNVDTLDFEVLSREFHSNNR